jgi:hypothetical protein
MASPLTPGNANDTADFMAVFSQDVEANKWRSATFEGIMASVLAADGGVTAQSLHEMYSANLREANSRISAVLFDVTGMPPTNEATRTIQRLTRLASELGLQFGVQPTHLNLSRPKPGQVVEIGREVFDCQDGDREKGKKVKVDLLVAPGIFKLGDGKGNLLAKIPLVPCDIYSLFT